MDLDRADEDASGSEYEDAITNTSHDDDQLLPSSEVEEDPDEQDPLDHLTLLLQRDHGKNLSELRWQRVGKAYRDEYREVFNQAQRSNNDPAFDAYLEETQLGAVVWHAVEKYRLYGELSRRGRHDLAALARAVRTKSQLEVADYLRCLQVQLQERHLFARHIYPSAVLSHADIPAAIEVSEKCEHALEHAADALAALQERYEHSTVDQNPDRRMSLLRIDGGLAQAIDAVVGVDETSDNHHSQPEFRSLLEIASLFHASVLTDLSENIFMNAGDNYIDQNWRNVALDDEKPALTAGVMREFRDLAINLTRKIMQSAIFLAQSRTRALKVGSYTHERMVRVPDVLTAVDILSMKRDSWDFWISAARRNRLQVVLDSHSKGAPSSSLPYEVVEDALTARVAKDYHRRSRSTSVATDASTDGNASDDSSSDSSTDVGSDASSPDRESIQCIDTTDGQATENDPGIFMSADEYSDTSKDEKIDPLRDHSDKDLEQDRSSEPGIINEEPVFLATTPALTAQRLQLEAQQDQYLESLDQANGLQESRRLRSLVRPVATITTAIELNDDMDETEEESDGEEDSKNKTEGEEEEQRLDKRPATLRKMPDELRDWTESVEYVAPEMFAWAKRKAAVDMEEGSQERGRKKRRRT